MKVRDFSLDIYKAAISQNDRWMPDSILCYGVEITSMFLSLLLTYDKLWDISYHLSGSVSNLLSKIIDKYSTLKVTEKIEDPRFFEYGFETCIYESNPALGKHPKSKDVFGKQILKWNLGFLALSTLLPPWGYGGLVSAPLHYKINSEIANVTEKAFEIGDHIKDLIEDGLSKDEINSYLDSLIDKNRFAD